MRNPYYIEVHIPKGESMFTCWQNSKKKSFKLGESITIQHFDSETQVDQIQELPQNLSNYYHTVQCQANKLPSLLAFLETMHK